MARPLRSWTSLVLVGIITMFTAASEGVAQIAAQHNITSTLRICTASIQDFGARCNGAPTSEFEELHQPDGPVPEGGWCTKGQDFCGYDVDVWSQVAERMGLQDSLDYERVCLGEGGFSYMIGALAGDNTTLGECDIGVSSITASTERENRGIRFSRATHRSALAILVHAPLKRRGMWAFFEPLHVYVWMALLGTIVVTPFFVFLFEAVFSKWTAYLRGEKLDIMSGLAQCMWHSVSHTLSIDVFHVRSIPARIITAAYAFLVLILTNTYTANLAAFLTVDQLDTTIQGISDLRGKAVATIEPYVNRLARNHHIAGSSADGWDYDAMIAKLGNGEYAAVISDDTQLIGRAYSDQSCSLHILGDMIEPFDLAIAFRRGFPSDTFRAAVSSALLDMQEDGTLSVSSLWGLWIILSLAVFVAAVVGLVEYQLKRRRKHEDADHINERVQQLRRKMSGAVSVQRATSAFWSSIERSRRSGSAVAALGSRGVPAAPRDIEAGIAVADAEVPVEKPEGLLWNRAAIVASKSMKRGETDVPADGAAAGPSTVLRRQMTRPVAVNRDGAAAATAADATPPQTPLNAAAHSSQANNVLQLGVRTPVSRQTSMGSQVGNGPVCSMGARSDTLEEPGDDLAGDHKGSTQGGPSTLHATTLDGLPHACTGGLTSIAQHPGGPAGELPGDADAELVQLNSIMQSVAQRVTVLCQTRRLQRRPQPPPN